MNQAKAGVDIMDYGADPTGTRDSGPALRAAWHAARAAGANVWVPDGIFAVRDGLDQEVVFPVVGDRKGDGG